MIKVNDKMFNRFMELMENYGEFVFGTKKEIKQQLEICLNRQGYWSACNIRLYYDNNLKDFRIESRF